MPRCPVHSSSIRQLKERHALVVAENGKPVIAALRRCVDGRDGRRLLDQQAAARARLGQGRRLGITPEARSTAALVEARRHGLSSDIADRPNVRVRR